MALFRRKRKGNEPAVDPNERAPESGVKHKDLAVLDQLRQHGADLSQPRSTRYYLYFASEEAAADAASRVRAAGFETEGGSTSGSDWSVICERHNVVATLDYVRAADDDLQAIADDLGGEFDGWEASL